VLLVTGDDVTCAEARDLLGDGLTTVAVKQGIGRYGARQIPPVRARLMIEEGACTALRDLKAVAPYNPGTPSEIVVEFTRTEAFDEYRRKPGVQIAGDRKLASRAGDWWTAWRQFFN
jgi:D-amino peptidase